MVAKLLVEEVIVRFGTPYVIHTDQGAQFESNLFQEMCRLLQIQKIRTTLRDMCNATWHAILNIQQGCNLSSQHHIIRSVSRCVIVKFGTPYVIHMDQGVQFESNLFQEVCRLLQIQKTGTTPYHPQSDGMVGGVHHNRFDGH
jgi:transposase InsO family protein